MTSITQDLNRRLPLCEAADAASVVFDAVKKVYQTAERVEVPE